MKYWSKLPTLCEQMRQSPEPPPPSAVPPKRDPDLQQKANWLQIACYCFYAKHLQTINLITRIDKTGLCAEEKALEV